MIVFHHRVYDVGDKKFKIFKIEGLPVASIELSVKVPVKNVLPFQRLLQS